VTRTLPSRVPARAGVTRRFPAVALLAGLLAVLISAPAGIGPRAVATAATTDLTLVTDATLTVQPAQGRVHVAMAVTARNTTSDTRTTTFWFDHGFLAVQGGATGAKITGAKGATVSVASRSADAVLLRIGFGARLYSGKAQTFQLSFDLPGTGAAANRLVRVGKTLVTFPVWAYASTGATGSRVTVRFPAGYDVTVESGTFASRTAGADGGTVLSSGTLASPLSFFAYVSGEQPATYRVSSVAAPVSGATIDLTMRAWADDPPWATRVGGMFIKALPILRTAIGIPWPHAGPIVVQEAVSRTADGYAGRYDGATGTIEVAYWASQAVMVHEAAHGWFNGSLLADRWAIEGFAALYAQRALAALKIKASPPALTAALAKVAYPLNGWTADTAPDPTIEAYGFAGSYALAAAIAKRAGDAALVRVWTDAAGGIGAYQPPPAATGGVTAPETVDAPPDWRGLLDLLEAETNKTFTDLWQGSVVRPGEVALLDARTAARTAYTRTLAVAGDWTLPRTIRDALRGWQFDAATAAMADARTVIAQHAALVAEAARVDLAIPDAMRPLFESGRFSAAASEGDVELRALDAVAVAEGQQTSRDDLLSSVGLLWSAPDADLAAAKAALAAGQLDIAVTSASAAGRTWTGAWQEGRRRALLGIALLAMVIVLGTSIATRARRTRRPVRAAGA
jgi:hypothetical protein